MKTTHAPHQPLKGAISTVATAAITVTINPASDRNSWVSAKEKTEIRDMVTEALKDAAVTDNAEITFLGLREALKKKAFVRPFTISTATPKTGGTDTPTVMTVLVVGPRNDTVCYANLTMPEASIKKFQAFLKTRKKETYQFFPKPSVVTHPDEHSVADEVVAIDEFVFIMLLTLVQEAGSTVTKQTMETLVLREFPITEYPCAPNLVAESVNLGYLESAGNGFLFQIAAKGTELLARDQAAQPAPPPPPSAAPVAAPAAADSGEFERLRARGIELKGLVEAAKAANSTLALEVKDSRKKAAELEKTKTTLEDEKARLEERLGTNATRLSSVRASILELEARARVAEEKITAGVAGMETELDEVRRKLKAMIPDI